MVLTELRISKWAPAEVLYRATLSRDPETLPLSYTFHCKWYPFHTPCLQALRYKLRKEMGSYFITINFIWHTYIPHTSPWKRDWNGGIDRNEQIAMDPTELVQNKFLNAYWVEIISNSREQTCSRPVCCRSIVAYYCPLKNPALGTGTYIWLESEGLQALQVYSKWGLTIVR